MTDVVVRLMSVLPTAISATHIRYFAIVQPSKSTVLIITNIKDYSIQENIIAREGMDFEKNCHYTKKCFSMDGQQHGIRKNLAETSKNTECFMAFPEI